MDLSEILAALTTEEGLSLAMIVGRDGLLIEGQNRASSSDMESLAAMSTRALVEAERLGRMLGDGKLTQIRLRFDSYLLLIESLTATDFLVAGVRFTGSAEVLFDAVARYRTSLQQQLNGL